jgi:aminoglycoside phosphotransferase (APT) family kinase protein
LHLRSIRFVQPPALEPDGWEAYVYRFRLLRCAGLPAAFDRPLVLRQYAGPGGLPRSRREFAAQSHAYRHGYPTPQPILFEENCRPLGGPFLIMEAVPGDTLLARLRGNWTRILSVAAHLARAQARLHELPTAGLSMKRKPFLARLIDELRNTIQTFHIGGLTAGVSWLDAHRPAETDAPCLLHLDFHPVNLIQRNDGECALIDWSEADVGDRHADLAMTIVLMRCAPVEGLGFHERLVAPVTRWFLARRYRIVYRRQRSIDHARLRYYLAWACLRRLATYGMWLRAGPLCNGSKPAALDRVTPKHVAELTDWFADLTATPAHLD